MPKQSKTSVQSSNYNVYKNLSYIGAVVLLIGGMLSVWGSGYITTMVHDELAAQKIYFPKAGSVGFAAAEYPNLQQYAGQLVDSPAKAQAYANDYIGYHLKKVAAGKVYSEVSAASIADPTNTTLQTQKQTLFQGDTLRAILLSTGYSYGTVGQILGLAGYVAFAGTVLLSAVGFTMGRKAKR